MSGESREDHPEISDDLWNLIAGVRAKRPRTVLDHILKHGAITTDELKETYGYNHPPRAIRDVKEQGIPLKMSRVVGPDGRSIASYTLDLEAAAQAGRSGRRAFPKSFKDALVATYGETCALCGSKFPARALQIDHRVPYEVGGESDSELDVADFMLVCGSCNRAKSWSCEHCENWVEFKDADLCLSCLWASPESYSHVALEERRRLSLSWTGSEVAAFDRLKARAEERGDTVEELAKDVLDEITSAD